MSAPAAGSVASSTRSRKRKAVEEMHTRLAPVVLRPIDEASVMSTAEWNFALEHLLLEATGLPHPLLSALVVPMCCTTSYIVLSNDSEWEKCRCLSYDTIDAIRTALQKKIKAKYSDENVDASMNAAALIATSEKEMGLNELWSIYKQHEVQDWEDDWKEIIEGGECIASWNERECAKEFRFEFQKVAKPPSDHDGAEATPSDDAQVVCVEASDTNVPYLVVYWSWVCGSIFSHDPVHGSHALREKLLEQMYVYCPESHGGVSAPNLYRKVVKKYGPLTKANVDSLSLMDLSRMSVDIGRASLKEGDDTGMRAVLKGRCILGGDDDDDQDKDEEEELTATEKAD